LECSKTPLPVRLLVSHWRIVRLAQNSSFI
jgi:hypothetical protein